MIFKLGLVTIGVDFSHRSSSLHIGVLFSRSLSAIQARLMIFKLASVTIGVDFSHDRGGL